MTRVIIENDLTTLFIDVVKGLKVVNIFYLIINRKLILSKLNCFAVGLLN